MISAEEFNCLFCKDQFTSKEELQIHFRKHGDPKFNHTVKSKPQSEMATCRDKPEEGEVVNCDVCEEVFPTVSKAITHKHKMHPDHDAKYFCPWCGKLFTMKHLYNKHIQTNHESKQPSGHSGFHCDYCEVDFFVPSAMIYHNKFFHRQDTELAAIGHSKKLKMFNQEPLLIYYCPFCGEEYCNKVNLHKHMGDDHIDENQSPEDVLRCPLCEAVFYHLDAYELHLTFHSTDDQYSEENELLKEITEFSLETVPPMMEKVENESQEDDPTESMGIEELLQQGMNESNDNDTNDGSGSRKKKKHKKHKKSKKTITLDEFLNMHSDVLGEDLDVQGIVEVPSQVVTKQLRKPQQQRIKKAGQKPLSSTELQKLKNAGIVIKKKSSPFKGMKIANKKPAMDAKQVGGNIRPSVLKLDSKVSSDDILTRLLNQSNSQIKIVKKPLEGKLDKAEEKSSTSMDLSEKDENGDGRADISSIDEDLGDLKDTDNINNINEENISIKSMEHENEDSLSQSCGEQLNKLDKNCSTKDGINVNQETKQNKCTSKEPVEKKQNEPENFNNSPSCDKSKQLNAINTLRNISQNITIKSLPTNKIDEDDNSTVSDTADTVPELKGVSTSKDTLSENTNKNPLSALQHLSHLTVKSANTPKIVTSMIHSKDVENKTLNNVMISETDDMDKGLEYETESQKGCNIDAQNSKDSQTTSMKLNALKNLSKHITVKSFTQSPQKPDSESDFEDSDIAEPCVSKLNSNVPDKQASVKAVKSPRGNFSSPNHSPKIQKPQLKNEFQTKDQQNTNILKQIPNIKAKPLNFAKNFNQTVTLQCATQSDKGAVVKNTMKKVETKQEEIEIFNVDDSDDDDVTAKPGMVMNQSNTPTLNSPKNIACKNVSDKSMDVLRNLSKHITVKSNNPPKLQTEEQSEGEEMLAEEPHINDSDNEYNEIGPPLKKQVNAIIQNKLKSLTNITMSRNSSPKNQALSAVNSPKLKHKTQMDDYDSDVDDAPGNVKITELPDDYNSDEDIPLQKIKNCQIENNQKLDNDVENDYETQVHDGEDIEALIKPTTLKKEAPIVNKTPAILNNLKGLTVKSVKENKSQDEEEIPEDSPCPITSTKQLTLRQSNQGTLLDEKPDTNNKPMRQQVRRAVNQNAATSSDQVNTVNKEVTVQTYQSKTVIQEITTTVTKTIRTVNQTTKQEVQNMCQKGLMHIRPQRLQGSRPNQQIKNFQGMSVRQATPMGPRLRPPLSNVKPNVGANNVRPSNQIMPVRPGVNVARLSNPRTPGPKGAPTPSTSNPHKSVVGKPLKISPNAMATTNKRHTSDEISGPFSCFKKPKESLFPGTMSSELVSECEGDSAVHYATSSQTSRSNFASMTKSVTGNSVITSTHTKSEVSASSEQLSRLNSMSGLKVVKTSQVKQAAKVEEKTTEVKPVTQTALSAIEKLQRQGLLVKKPRIEEPDDSDNSNHDTDDDYYDT